MVERGARGLEGGARGGEAFAEVADVGFFGEGEDVVNPGAGLVGAVAAIGVGGPIEAPAAGWEGLLGVDVVEAGEADLFQVVRTRERRALSRADWMAGRRQGDEDADDRDDDE